MKLKTIINNLEKIRQEYIKKNGHEPVLWDFEADPHEGELCIDLVKGKKKIDIGTQATSPADTFFVKWAR